MALWRNAFAADSKGCQYAQKLNQLKDLMCKRCSNMSSWWKLEESQ